VDQPVVRRLLIDNANKTDGITWDRPHRAPPGTARAWTEAAFAEYDSSAFDTKTSRYPSHANLTTEGFVADAHITLFSIHPSTIVHESGDEPTMYLSPTGRMTAMVDYRERVPKKTVERVSDPDIDRRVTTYTVQLSSIENVTVTADGTPDPEKRRSDTHRPTFSYNINDYGGSVNRLGVKAEIVVTVRETTKEYPADGTGAIITSTRMNTTRVTVTDARAVAIHELNTSGVTSYRAAPADGAERVALRADTPWSMLRLQGENARLATKWRFFTARTPGWDQLTIASEDDTEKRPAPDIPVYVHGVPTTNPPVAEASEPGVSGKVTSDDEAGPERSPPESVPEAVGVSTVNESYQPRSVLAVRFPNTSAPYDATVVGLVNGTNVTRPSGDFQERSLSESQLIVRTERQNASHTVLFVKVQGAQSGAPISLAPTDIQYARLFGGLASTQTPSGQVVIQGHRTTHVVRPPSDGTTIAVPTHGMIFAEYQPASWISKTPAYQPTRASAKSQRLASLSGLLGFISIALTVLIPLWMAIKLAQGAARLVRPEDFIE